MTEKGIRMIMSKSERDERYRATRGYIGNGGQLDGIVICGSCFDDLRFGAAQSFDARVRFEEAALQRYNPQSGDDFCSVCDADIPNVWRSLGAEGSA
jgi:hypothetical protein